MRRVRTAVAVVGAGVALLASTSSSAKQLVVVGSRTLHVAQFVLPAGETMLVEHSFVVHARGRLVVAGTIELAAGARLTLRGGPILISGGIVPTGGNAVDGPPVQIGPEQGKTSVTIDGPVTSDPGQSIVVAAGPGGSITVDAPVTTRDGIDSTASTESGGSAGNIVLEAGPFGKAAKIVVDKAGSLHAGNGGRGFIERTASLNSGGTACNGRRSRRLIADGSSGGNGGSIRIYGKTIVVKGEIDVGAGGTGGSVRGVQAGSAAPGFAGDDLAVTTGGGGDGGSILAPGSPIQTTEFAGRGGDGGSASDLEAGNGGRGCDGGRTTIFVGRPGHNGATGRSPVTQPSAGSVSLKLGGAGGVAVDAEHRGGDGGAVDLHFPLSLEPGRGAGTISITDAYSDGGDGISGCGSRPPTRGGNGGDAGTITVSGIFTSKGLTIADSFNGGDAANGHPPGEPGKGGKAPARLKAAENLSFREGKPGLDCPPTTTTTPGTSAHYSCTGNQVKLFDNTNGQGVNNGGTPPTFSTNGKTYCLQYIQTYHWNGGNGVAPGKLGLKRVSGPPGFDAVAGPFQALASSGQNNAPNVNWYVYPSRTPPAVIDGTYECTDSGATTWSSNKLSGGAGFCIVQGIPAVKQ